MNDLGEKLRQAVESGDSRALVSLLEGGADTELTDPRDQRAGWTLLLLAAATGQLECVKALLRAGSDLEAREQVPPSLQYMASESNAETLRLHTKLTLGRTPLGLALEFGHQQVAGLLIDAGAELNEKDPLGLTPFHLAVQGGLVDAFDRMLKAGAQVKVTGPRKTTVLAMAIEHGHDNLFVRLLGLHRWTKTQIREALFEACRGCRAKAIEELLSVGADVNAKTKKGGPPLAIAAGATRTVVKGKGIGQYKTDEPYPEERVLEAVEVLLAANPDLDQPGELGTPLMRATWSRHSRVVGRLLEAGADPKVRFKGENALNLAQMIGAKQIAEVLKEVGVDQKSQRRERQQAPSNYKEAPAPELTAASQGRDFQALVARLGSYCGSTPQAAEHPQGGYLVRVQTPVLESRALESLHQEFLEEGAYLYAAEGGMAKLGILPLVDALEAIAAIGTAGPNSDVGPGNIIDWFRGQSLPFRITSLDRVSLAGHFLKPIPDRLKMARSMYELCPDIVDQGCFEVENLADELRGEQPRIYFWWD